MHIFTLDRKKHHCIEPMHEIDDIAVVYMVVIY